jgi:transposase-like protein
MIDADEMPRTLMQAVRYFADPEICEKYMRSIKWPDGKITCPACGSERIGEVKTRRLIRCKDCRKQISAKVGTIFEDSPLGLDKWFVAVWCVANCKNGISSHELARALGIRQPSAWFMLHRIRLAMRTRSFRKLSGEVESDETFIGGKAANMHAGRREKLIRGRGAVGKTIVQGLLERTQGGKLSEFRGFVVPNTADATLCPNVYRNVANGSTVYTDALPSYGELAIRYFHHAVDHATRYVVGVVHTNGLENFWSLLKRTIRGTYVAVAEFHLFRYLDEQAFRFNNRETNDGNRFWRLLKSVVGKRLTYRALTAQGDAGFMGIR